MVLWRDVADLPACVLYSRAVSGQTLCKPVSHGKVWPHSRWDPSRAQHSMQQQTSELNELATTPERFTNKFSADQKSGPNPMLQRRRLLCRIVAVECRAGLLLQAPVKVEVEVSNVKESRCGIAFSTRHEMWKPKMCQASPIGAPT